MTLLTPTAYIVLGLLERAGSATPYDLKGLVAASIGNFWSVPHSQLYAEPARLADAGFVSERRELAGRRRRTYRLTDTGQAALDAWRAQPTEELPELRDAALLKLFFGADPAVIAPLQLSAHEGKLAEYREIQAALRDDEASAGPARTLDAGLGHEQEWVRFWRALHRDPGAR